jgi:hypothetical protein
MSIGNSYFDIVLERCHDLDLSWGHWGVLAFLGGFYNKIQFENMEGKPFI